jgi:hypothetical protein
MGGKRHADHTPDAVFIDLKRIAVDHMQIKAHRSKD